MDIVGNKGKQNRHYDVLRIVGVRRKLPSLACRPLLLMLVLIIVLRGQVRHGGVGAALLIMHGVVGVKPHVRHLSRQALWLLCVVGRKRCNRGVDRRVCVHRLLLLDGTNRIHAILLYSALHVSIMIWLIWNLESVRIAIEWLPRNL